MIHLMLKYIPYRISLNKVIIILNQATLKVVSKEIIYGEIPPYSVVVPGSLPSDKGGPNLYCAVIVKQVDEKTRSKTSINDLLRD